MRLLVFSPYYPPHIGGLETHSNEFNKYLALNGADIVVFTPNIPTLTDCEETTYDRVRIVRYPAFEIIPNYPVPKFWDFGFWKLFITLSRADFDIVISRTRFFLSSLLALAYAKSQRVPLIHIEHGSDFVRLSSRFKTFFAKMYDRSFGRLVFRSSNINISISKAVQKFVERFDERESPVIYRGLDFDAIDATTVHPSLRSRFPNKILLVTAARLYKWKGIEHVIGAIHRLPEELRSKITYLIIGDGEDFHRLEKLSQGLPVEMLGKLERPEVIGILKASDIYIHSSLPGGGLSTSLLEAMYCDCAVIATPNEGADEIISHNDNGMLIGSPSAEEIKKVLQGLIPDEKNRKRLSTAAKESVRERFSWNASIEKYLRILKMLQK